jgi:hypothetical protein
MMVFVVSLTFFHAAPKDTYSALTGKPFVVRLELEQLRREHVDYASIELPAGVYFHSDKYPDIKTQNRLEVAVAELGDLEKLPFVIRSDDGGTKQITISLFDKNKKLISEKKLGIIFKGERA